MLSKREKTIGYVTCAVLGALVLDRAVLTPLTDRLGAADDRVLAAQQQLTGAQDLFQNDLRARRAWKEMAGTTLQQNAPAAESQVSNALHAWAQQSGLALTSLKPERSEAENDFQRITIRATATGTMEQVTRFLYAVQTANIPIRISDIQLVSRSEGTDELSLQIGLSTIYLPAEEPPEATANGRAAESAAS